jgi:hypothetical protein
MLWPYASVATIGDRSVCMSSMTLTIVEVFFEITIYSILVRKTCNVVDNIDHFARLCSSDGGTSKPSTDHLAVEDDALCRPRNKNYIGFWRIEPSC